MHPQLVTLDSPCPPHNTKTILAKDGFRCSIITVAPGAETPLRAGHEVEEHVLFIIDGEATIRFGELNTILKQDEALLIPKGQEHLIAAGRDVGAKIFRVDVPPREVVTPQILMVAR